MYAEPRTPVIGAMSVEQFARWAGIGRTMAYEQIRLGKLAAHKLGRRTLITIKSAEDWLARLPSRCLPRDEK